MDGLGSASGICFSPTLCLSLKNGRRSVDDGSSSDDRAGEDDDDYYDV